MLFLPRALSCTPVFYFKLAAGGSGKREGAGVRVRGEKSDSEREAERQL